MLHAVLVLISSSEVTPLSLVTVLVCRGAEGHRSDGHISISSCPMCHPSVSLERYGGGDGQGHQLVPGTGASVAVEHEWRSGGR